MTLSVRRIETDAEREAIYAFRYRVYVEEMAMTSEADHERKWLRDDLDDVAASYAVFDDGEVMGSLRCAFLSDVAEPQSLIDKFHMEPAIDAFGAEAIITTSRFILDSRLRHGTIIFRLMQEAFKDGLKRGLRINYGDCSPHLLPFYEHLGYRRYTRGYNDTAYGYKVPIIMLTGDADFLKQVRSPLARIAAAYPDDAEARAWFAATYPHYVDLESACFMPTEQFFDVLAERVASDPLHRVALLRGLERQEADRFLQRATLVQLAPGDLIVRHGDRDNTLYVLLSGLAEVAAGDPKLPPLAVLGPGDTFGEISQQEREKILGTNAVRILHLE